MKSGYRAAAVSFFVFLLALVLMRSATEVGATAAGQIVGTVKLDGKAPAQRLIDMSNDPSCAQTRSGSPAATESVVVGRSNGLANVVVYISQGLTGTEPSHSQTVMLDQKGCQYVPHVVALNPGQHMTIINNDKTVHNIHPAPKTDGGNRPFNKSQVAGSPPIDVTWTNEEVAIPVKCNIHPWMRAYIVVVKGPYGVSDDSGSFNLDGVPPGTYTLTAWHETYGKQTQTVTVGPGKPATADFVFKAK